MGELDEPHDCGAFEVVLERDAFAPGDPITGVVLFQAHRSILDAVITVDLRGRECIDTTDDVDTKALTSEHSVWFHAVERRRVSVSSTDGLDLPFSIDLPTDLPATVQFAFGSRRTVPTNVRIVYDVVCAIHIAGEKSAERQHCTPFLIEALPLARRIGQRIHKERTQSFHHGFRLKKSECHVHVRLDSDVVTVDSLITAHVQIDLREERARLQSLSMVLWRRLVPNPSQPLLVRRDSKQVASICRGRTELSGTAESVLQLPVPPSMLSEVGPLKPTLSFHHFSVVYEVVVTCEVKSCAPVRIQVPVTVLPLCAEPLIPSITPIYSDQS